MLDSEKLFALINVANVESGLLTENFVRGPDDIDKYREISLGIPVLIPAYDDLFIFKEVDVFSLEPSKLLEIIYGHADHSYVGFTHSFRKFSFLSNYKVRDNYAQLLGSLVKQNKSAMIYAAQLKKEHSTVGAFQTRNIPHFGHEEIMKQMLNRCDHLVINPVLGPKKKGDATMECLENIFMEFFSDKFSGRISFKPIIANMFYAGPREAVHHARIRKMMRFDLFSVGRDHAGAANIYPPDAAPELIDRLSSKLGIKVFCHHGAVFCKNCNAVVLRHTCAHPEAMKSDISGTEFRKCLVSGSIFKHARTSLQNYLADCEFEVFEND